MYVGVPLRPKQSQFRGLKKPMLSCIIEKKNQIEKSGFDREVIIFDVNDF